MLPSRSLGPLFALALAGTVAIACGTSDGDSEFDENAQSGGDAGNGGSGDNTGFGGGNGSGNGAGDGNGDGTGGNNGPACAAQSAVAERAPAYLYFLFDRSGSMGLARWGGDPEKKLNPVKAALSSFLQSAGSKGISASLTLFPAKTGNNCSTSSYAAPVVGLSALPEKAQDIISKLPMANTTDLGDDTVGTPTRPAVGGLLPEAVKNLTANPDGKTVVVLLTDGDPNQCSNNSVTDVANELKKYRDKVPTYVIGIGSVSSLNTIADGGGTGSALIVSVGDAAKTQRELSEKIEQIRLSTLSCDVAIPAPPSGETLDLNKVNVSFTPKGGTKSALGYDPDCKADGWRFDNPTTPTKISLCTCDATKKDPDSKIEVEFGCARRTGGIK